MKGPDRGVIKASVIKRDRSICAYCTKKLGGDEVTLDHLIPKAHHGPYAEWNLVVACQPCNLKRGMTYPPPPTSHTQWEATYLRESLPDSIDGVKEYLANQDREREFRKRYLIAP